MRIYRIQHPTASALTEVRSLLFKPDHPRAIDRYIDYFGGPHAAPWTPVLSRSRKIGPMSWWSV